MIKKMLLTAAIVMSSILPAQSKTVYSEDLGQWTLTAWDGSNRFCALKTYYRGLNASVSIRLSSHSGLELVVFDSNVEFAVKPTDVTIFFNGKPKFRQTGVTPITSTQQVFIPLGFDDRFFEYFQGSQTMQIRSENIQLNLGLIGTRALGNKIVDCVRYFGM